MQTQNQCHPTQTAAWMNENCACQSLDTSRLGKFTQTYFAPTPVFITKAEFASAQKSIQLIQSIVKHPSYQREVLATAPAIAQGVLASPGIFMSYDFHLSEDGLNLIELNTNAGGAFLIDHLMHAQSICCWEEQPLTWPNFDQFILKMFETEWTHFNTDRQLRTIAIVDENPEQQFLYDEFCLAKELLERFGWKAIIADPTQLQWDGQNLMCGEDKIDFVYNRSTDFYLEKQSHAALKAAFAHNAIALSPNPRHHALFAKKDNLARLSDPEFLSKLNCSNEEKHQLQQLIQAALVTPQIAEELWRDRKQYFFKPFGGHAGKAVYRGDKLTHKNWDYILASEYIAQKLFKPNLRLTKQVEGTAKLKSDLRFYTYNGEIFAAAARLYQGQTTNFRTQGGGFAPLFLTDN